MRLSAGVRVHRTASHERSPLRGRGADPGAFRKSIEFDEAPPPAGMQQDSNAGILREWPLKAGYSWRRASMGSRREALRAG